MADLYPVWTRGGIPWCISTPTVEFVQGMHGPDGHHMTLNAQVRFSDFGMWKRAMLGWSALSQNNTLTRVPPEQVPWPQDASLPIEQQSPMPLYCTQIMPKRWWGNGVPSNDESYLTGFKGVPQPVAEWNNWPCPEWVECQVTFEALKYSVWADDDEQRPPGEWNRYLVYRERPASENEKVPLGSICWFPDDVVDRSKARTIGETFFRRGSINRLEWKWLSIPKIPEANLVALSGKVNANPFSMILPTGEVRTWGAEKLVFDTHEIEPVHGPDGELRYNLTLFLVARTDARSWNQLFDPVGNLVRLFRCFLNGLGQFQTGPAFETGDFELMFSFTE